MYDYTQLIGDAEATAVWNYFHQISEIPRCSKNEAQIRAWLKSTAEALQLSWSEDKVGNILIRKPASPGNENKPVVVLQSHMDMVCEKNSSSSHDFNRDPIRWRREGDRLYAQETSLGADNGIGMAFMLAMLSDRELESGPLEALFTVDEETGLTGAIALTEEMLTGRLLLNLDSEEDWGICIGCAGGLDSHLYPDIPFTPVDAETAVRIRVSGLKGGHSGMDIHSERGNATLILGHLLSNSYSEIPFRLGSLSGGSKHNAIPREAEAVVYTDDSGKLVKILNRFADSAREIYRDREAGMTIEISTQQNTDPAMSREDTLALLALLVNLPHGVHAMSPTIPGQVETSSNTAIVQINPQHASILVSHRSSSRPSLDEIALRLRLLAEYHQVKVEQSGGYPPWTPLPESKLLSTARTTFTRVHGRAPEVFTIHAGLECGIIGDKYPGMEMLSIGPNISNPHSPDEFVEVSSVDRFNDFLRQLLQELAR